MYVHDVLHHTSRLASGRTCRSKRTTTAPTQQVVFKSAVNPATYRALSASVRHLLWMERTRSVQQLNVCAPAEDFHQCVIYDSDQVPHAASPQACFVTTCMINTCQHLAIGQVMSGCTLQPLPASR